MVANRRLGVLGFGKQSAIGTALANPTYTVPKVSGGIKPVQDRADLPLTGDTAQPWGQYKQHARAEGTVTILAHPDAIGLLFYEAMGGQAVSGAGPYSHVFTLSDLFPLPMTAWDLVGDQWWKFTDCYVPKITLRAGSSDVLAMIEFDLIACGAVPVVAPTCTLVEPAPRHKFLGSLVNLEADNAVPALVNNCESMELVVDRAPELRYGASLTPIPALMVPNRSVQFSAGMVYDTSGNNQGWDFLKAAHLGTVAGTGLDQVITSGSFDVTLGRHPVDNTRTLRVASNGADWDYLVDRPDADPGGGPLEYDIAGIVRRPTGGGTEVTITLINDVVAAY